MNVSRLAPWNWFRKEEEQEARSLPTPWGSPPAQYDDMFSRFHRHMDQIFDDFMRGFGPSMPMNWATGAGGPQSVSPTWLKPIVDVGAGENEYTISLEMPGVLEDDIDVEIVGDTLTVSAEKRQQSEQKDKNFYRMERSYGSFRRILSLPEDADADNIDAKFRNGVMTLTIPRRAVGQRETKRIEVKAA